MSKTLNKQALLEHIGREIEMAEQIKSVMMTKRMKYQHDGIIRALKDLQKEIKSGRFDVRDHQPADLPDEMLVFGTDCSSGRCEF